ncbi:cysteine desulfurase family protein [Bovifimicola ammoniilytica]|jgi:cysteine desulfurase|uniref:cysteine desulfurase family protein n=1 Tax=Bovifimicola ammoniilytica TaxID=2981720 RepID=UPI000820CEE3|nr:cysteine desulfurase family protein [Bovifimicola ammoniilytica]MCU6753164.1 cysteine desulfurase [Bovifimicola ammoniilytica]SCJ55982.1 Cysteine desulfurase [uncultured Eubacterium sp.]
MEAYLDNSATTKVFDEVKDIMVETMLKDYGNPSSMHLRGVEAEKYVKEARENIAKTLKVDEKEIVFTSGGTESNNMAIIGTALANKRAGNHIITTAVEHASVHNTMEFLAEQGFRITYLNVNESGVINIKDLEDAICDDTILISVMYVNNEIGSVMPISEIAEVIKAKKPDVVFHVDAIQAYGKYHIYPRRMGIDLLSVSGHKIHGPKGSGFLYVRDKLKIKPIIYGGGQQKGMRSGTENVPGIAGIGVAAKKIYENFDENIDRLYELKDYLIDELSKIENVRIHSKKGRDFAPQIVNASFVGVRSEVLLHSLEDRKIYVSAGSACSTNKHTVSATLKGIGLDFDEIESAIRFSFCIFTTKEEIDYTVSVINELLPRLRLFRRK